MRNKKKVPQKQQVSEFSYKPKFVEIYCDLNTDIFKLVGSVTGNLYVWKRERGGQKNSVPVDERDSEKILKLRGFSKSYNEGV